MPENRWAKFPKFKKRKRMAFTHYWGRNLISILSHLLEYINDKHFQFGSILKSCPNTITSSLISKNIPIIHIEKKKRQQMKFILRCVKSLGSYKIGRLGNLPNEREILLHHLEIFIYGLKVGEKKDI